MRCISVGMAVGVCMILGVARPTLAQRAAVGTIAVSADHDLLAEPLWGGAVDMTFPRSGRRLALGVGLDHTRSWTRRIGIPCAGLIMPGTCAPEPLRDVAHLTRLRGLVDVRAVSAKRVRVFLTGALGLGQVSVNTFAEGRGRVLSAPKLLWGGDVSARADYTPLARVPLAIEVASGLGAFNPLPRSGVVDGYTPFENSFPYRWFRAGLVWRHGHAR